jgi:hypothetical protein
MEWKSHIVLACITCSIVRLLTKIDKHQAHAYLTCQSVIQFVFEVYNSPMPPSDDKPINMFIPTVCPSCDKEHSWTSLSISGHLLKSWQPYLLMHSFLNGDLAMLSFNENMIQSTPIKLMHWEDVRSHVEAGGYLIQDMELQVDSGGEAYFGPVK